jgi:glycosyltransferase involved in cell wall biosynthesis
MITTKTRKHPSGSSSAASGVAPAKVLLAGKLTALDAPGGGEVQMAAMAECLPPLGVDARLWRPWEDALEEADCLHLFGSVREHLPVVEAARRRGVPVALSTIAWFELANCFREPRPVVRRLAAGARFLARTVCPPLPSWRRELYRSVDMLMPNSNAEARQLIHYFGVPAERILVTPNGADVRFAEADPQPFRDLVAEDNFVLYAGRIEPRKNQLRFLCAMRGSDVPIVILGDVVPGYQWYFDQCRRMAGPNVKFIGRIDHDDPLLASAYAACGCLVLASWFETPGLAALEAGMSGTSLVLPTGGCATEYFGHQAIYVKPNDLSGIRRAVGAALDRGRSGRLASHVQNYFSWQATARITLAGYKRLLQEATS